MTLITFTVQGAAAPQGSKRHLGHGVMIESSKRVKPWRSDVRDAAYEAMHRVKPPENLAFLPALTAPVKVAVEFVYRRPAGHFLSDGASLSAAGRRAGYPPGRGSKSGGDLDKLVRAILDSLSGIVFVDDGQVVDIRATKVYGPRDECRVQVLEVTP